ncbi:MAG: hypothetical protein ABSH00_04165 [Bryobacteraceae bacterium]|jgi:hypothetical protein
MYKTKYSPIERCDVLLHGWDAQTESWNGPIPLVRGRRGARFTSKVRTAQGAFQGKLRCSVPGLPCLEFYTAVYELRDAGIALVHLDGSHAGPVGIVAVVPQGRRKFLRDDFAFELMTVISFLGAPINSGCELQINDYIEETLRTEPSATHIFAVETAELNSDVSIVLSAHFEHLAAAMLDWMASRVPQDDGMAEAEECEIRTIVPGDCPPALPLHGALLFDNNRVSQAHRIR